MGVCLLFIITWIPKHIVVCVVVFYFIYLFVFVCVGGEWVVMVGLAGKKAGAEGQFFYF